MTEPEKDIPICQFCKATFNTRSGLFQHQRTVASCVLKQENLGIVIKHKKDFSCDGCKKKFTASASLAYHVERCKEKIINMKDDKIKHLEHLKTDHVHDKECLCTEKDMKIKELQGVITSLQETIKKLKPLGEEPHKTVCDTVRRIDRMIETENGIDSVAFRMARNKTIHNFLQLQTTKDYIKVFICNTGITFSRTIETWVSNKIGYYLAQWISYKFTDKKASLKELECMYQENNSLKKDYQTLLVKHNSSMKTHQYFKFKEKGPCFYIIENGISCACNHNIKKFGIAGLYKDNEDTFDNRLRSHRTLWPQLKVNFVIFMKEVDFLEKTIKRFYEKEINPNGHEIMEGVTTEQIVERIHKWIHDMSITYYTIASDEYIQKYNDYVITTIKVNE